MAATIAKATGYDSWRRKDVHRLGSQGAGTEAATWRTFARVFINRDGSGSFSLIRDGFTIPIVPNGAGSFHWGPEE